MRTVARAVAVGVTVALMCAPALAQKVAYDFHRNQDFSHLRTFSIRDTPPADVYASRTTIYDGPIVRQKTNAAVAAQLEARGMRRDNERPDVYVTTHRTFQMEYAGYSWPGSGWGYWGYYGYSYYAEPIVVGTLTVDIVKAATSELLWRGVSERDMHTTSSSEHRLERINKEVSKIFKKYPTGTVATSGRETPQPTGR